MVLRGLVLLCLLISLDTVIFSRLRVKGGYGPTGPTVYGCAPSLPLGSAVFSRFDGGGVGVVLRRRVPLCPLTPLYTTLLSRLTVGRRVWSYGFWYCCAPSLPLDTAVFYRFDGEAEGLVLRGLVLLCPLPPS